MILQLAAVSIGVMVVGDDPVAAGSLQEALETQLAVVKNVKLRTGAELAPRIAVVLDPPASAELSTSVAEEMGSLTREISRAYYDDELDKAVDALDTLRSLENTNPATPASVKVRSRLWLAAVLVAQNKRERALSEVADALVLSPDLVVDKVAFPPSVVDVVRDARAGISMVDVTLRGLPPDARVQIDDREIATPAQFRVPVGEHVLSVSATSFRTVSQSLDITKDVAIGVALPLALDPANAKVLDRIAWTGSVSAVEGAALEGLAKTADVDAFVVVTVQPTGVRGLMWVNGQLETQASALLKTTSPGRAALGMWASKTVEQWANATDPTQVPLPKPVRVGQPYWSADAQLLWTRRFRTVTGADSSFTSDFWGQGFRIASETRTKRGFKLHLRLDLITYDLIPTTFLLSNGQSVDLGGGFSSALHLGVGYEKIWARKSGPVFALGGSVEIWGERLAGEDIEGPTGNLGVFPVVGAGGVGVLLDGRYWIPNLIVWGSPFEIDVLLGSSPYSVWSQVPQGVYGNTPRADPTGHFSIRLVWRPRDFTVAVGYQGERRDVQLSGQGTAAIDPPLSGARVREVITEVSLTFGKAF